jgi:hypothetical protein
VINEKRSLLSKKKKRLFRESESERGNSVSRHVRTKRETINRSSEKSKVEPLQKFVKAPKFPTLTLLLLIVFIAIYKFRKRERER